MIYDNSNTNDDDNDIDEETFEKQLSEQIDVYFSYHEFIDENSLPEFLDSVGLSEWNTPEDISVLWKSLKNYSNEGKVNKENTKKGLYNFIADQPEDDINRMSVCVARKSTSINPTLNNINKNIDYLLSNQQKENDIEKIISESDENILRKLLCIFNILYLNNRKKIKLDEIEHTLKMYNFLGFSTNYIINFLISFSNYDKNENSFEIINKKYESIQSKILTIVTKYKHTYLSFSLSKRNENNIYGDNPISYNNVIDDLINIEKECECYTAFLSKDRETNNKEYLIKEILFLNEKRLGKIETLRNYFEKFTMNIKNLQEEYQELNQKFLNRNENDDTEQIQNLLDEINILKNEKDLKNEKIEDLQKDIIKKEAKIQEIINKYNEQDLEIENLNKNLNDLKLQNEQLKKNYDEGITHILDKIKFDNDYNNENKNSFQKNLINNINKKVNNNNNDDNNLDENYSENKDNNDDNNKFKGMNYNNLIDYSNKLDKDNQYLNNRIKEFENQIEKLKKQIEMNNNNYESSKKEIFV